MSLRRRGGPRWRSSSAWRSPPAAICACGAPGYLAWRDFDCTRQTAARMGRPREREACANLRRLGTQHPRTRPPGARPCPQRSDSRVPLLPQRTGSATVGGDLRCASCPARGVLGLQRNQIHDAEIVGEDPCRRIAAAGNRDDHVRSSAPEAARASGTARAAATGRARCRRQAWRGEAKVSWTLTGSVAWQLPAISGPNRSAPAILVVARRLQTIASLIDCEGPPNPPED